jgi:undecaprenyl-diphosphatase
MWGTTFCLLGYIFWRSFSQVSKIAGQATLAFGILAVVVGGIYYAQRRLKDPAERERLERWMDGHRGTRWLWRRVLRPVARVAWPHVRFLWRRVTPGNLGLEFTTTMAVAVGGAYVFIFFASLFNDDPTRVLQIDNSAFDLVDRAQNQTLVDIAKFVTAFGSLPVVLILVLAGSVLLIVRRRPLELFALAGGFGLVVLATHLAKAAVDRPRPPGALVGTLGSAYPSGHAAYATAYIAMAVIAARVLDGIVSRTVLVVVGVLITAVIGATRVYLRAHYVSDVLGGYGLGLAIFAGCAGVALVVGFIRQNERAAARPQR